MIYVDIMLHMECCNFTEILYFVYIWPNFMKIILARTMFALISLNARLQGGVIKLTRCQSGHETKLWMNIGH